MNVKYECDCDTPEVPPSLLDSLYQAGVAAANAFYKACLPLYIALEDAGVLKSTYDEELLEPEWDVFV